MAAIFSKKYSILKSLKTLDTYKIGRGVIKTSPAEKIAGSVLGLSHLRTGMEKMVCPVYFLKKPAMANLE